MKRFGIFLVAFLCLGLVSGMALGQDNDIIEVDDIAELRAGETDGTVYKLTGEAILTYQQSFRNKKWIQDQTAAIEIDDNDGIISTEYDIYDGITGITGTLNVHNNLLQFIPTEDPGDATSTGNELEPAVLSVDEITSDYQSQLVRVENVAFVQTGTFSTGTNYDIYDAADTITYRTNFFEADYINDPIPETQLNMYVIVGQFWDTMQLTARNWTDIEIIHSVTFNVDISAADPFDPETDDVYVTGTFAGWAEPGSEPNFKMEPTEQDTNIYSLTVMVEEGAHEYKYFRVIGDDPSWDYGEWAGDPNRSILVTGDVVVNDVWGVLDQVMQALMAAAAETTMELVADINQLTATITFPDEIADTLKDDWKIDAMFSADQDLIAGTEVHFTYNESDPFIFVLESDLEAGDYMYLSEMLPADAPTRTALGDHAGRTDVWDFNIISPISVDTEVTVASVTSNDDFTTEFVLEDDSVQLTIEADIDKALELAAAATSLELLSALNHLTATIMYPESFFDVITDDWRVDAAITSSEDIPEGTEFHFTYNEGDVMEFELTEALTAGDVLYLSEMLPEGAPARTPLIDHADRTDVWDFQIISPASLSADIAVESVTSDDDFDTYFVLADDTVNVTVISKDIADALQEAADSMALDLTGDLNEITATITYPEEFGELITDMWKLDALISASTTLNEGTHITFVYNGEHEFEYILEDDILAGSEVFLSDLLPEDAPSRTSLIDHAGRVDVWDFHIMPTADHDDVELTIRSVTSADDFANYFELLEGSIQIDLETTRTFVFYVDMRGSADFDPDTDDVYISGVPDWEEPGTDPDLKMEPEEAFPMIYSVEFELMAGPYQFKFFRVIDDQPGWGNDEWPGDPNREVEITEDGYVYSYWGEEEVDAMPIVMARDILDLGSEVVIEGVITRAMGDFTRMQDETAGYVVRSTGDRNWNDDVDSGELRDGDLVRVTGITSQFASLQQINQDDLLEYVRLERDQPLPDPIELTLADIAADGRKYQSMLVFVNELIIDTDDEVYSAATTYSIRDETVDFGVVDLRTGNPQDTFYDGEEVISPFSFTGVLGQFDFNDPNDGFQLMPIREGDIDVVVSIVDDERGVPTVFRLEQNYPNPFNPSTTIDFSIPEQVQVTLEIYNVLGQRVATLVSGEMYDPGHYNVVWDGRNQAGNPVSSGMYIYRIQAGDFTDVKKMMFLK